jgi:hypothetical protein
MVSNGGSIVQGGSGTTTTVLHGNVAGVPVYGAVTLTTDVAGTLPIANGGTNNPALAVTLGGVIIGNGVQLINTGPGVVGNVLKSNGAAAPTWGPAPINDYAIYEEQEPSGTSGGTSVFSAWTQRVLNTTVSSSGASISRAGNVITLVAGTYKVLAYGMAFNPTNYYLRLQNTSLASTALLGITEYGATGGTGADYSSKAIIEGVITVAATNTFDIEYFINFSQANGLGIGGNSGITNVFSHIHIERIQ